MQWPYPVARANRLLDQHGIGTALAQFASIGRRVAMGILDRTDLVNHDTVPIRPQPALVATQWVLAFTAPRSPFFATGGVYPCDQAEDLGFTAFKFARGYNQMTAFEHFAITTLGTCGDKSAIEIVTAEATAVIEVQLSAARAATADGPYLDLVFEAIAAEGWRRCTIDRDGLVEFSTLPNQRQGGDWMLHHLLQLDDPRDSGPKYFAIPIKTSQGKRRDWSWHWALQRGAVDKRTKYLVIEAITDGSSPLGYMLADDL